MKNLGNTVASSLRTPKLPCRYFEMGQCFRGDACEFEHDASKIADKAAPPEEWVKRRNPLDFKAQIREYRHFKWYEEQTKMGLLNKASGTSSGLLGSGVAVETGAGFVSFDAFKPVKKD